MKTKLVLSGAILGLGLVQHVLGFYNPCEGRWLSRDPIEETGSENLYSFADNDSITYVDVLGAVIFDGCTPTEQQQIQSDLASYCSQIQTPGFASCLGHCSIPRRLDGMCQSGNFTIVCERSRTGSCSAPPGKQACGHTPRLGNSIHLCPDALNGNCGPLGCTLIHEMIHAIGHWTEKWPPRAEKCLNCP